MVVQHLGSDQREVSRFKPTATRSFSSDFDNPKNPFLKFLTKNEKK